MVLDQKAIGYDWLAKDSELKILSCGVKFSQDHLKATSLTFLEA